jgi:hypothetical protein
MIDANIYVMKKKVFIQSFGGKEKRLKFESLAFLLDRSLA